jgi:hypothetical protein
VKLFRQLSTTRLLALLAAVAAVAALAAVGAMAAFGSSAQTPPAKPLDQALQDALQAPQPVGISARVKFTNNLFPSGALAGISGTGSSALTSGGSGRLWWSPADGRGRIELQSDAGDAQIFWSPTKLTIWDSSSNTVYTLPLPAHGGTTGTADTGGTQPTLGQIDDFLQHLGEQANVDGPIPSSIADQPAYQVSVSPAHSAGLIGSLELAWDAEHGVPLELALRAQGQSTPALALTVNQITFGPVSAADFDVTPPADAKQVELGGQTGHDAGTAGGGEKVSGVAAVQAAVPFTLVAPDTLVGLPRQSVQLLAGDHPGALVLYGHGLGGIALIEHASDAGQAPSQASQLPSVALGSTTGHELATQLGTVLLFDQGGVSFVLAGSMPPTAAEAAARSLG